MATTTALDPSPTPVGTLGSLRRAHGLAVVRIVFGVVWAIDAFFKWLPGFRDPATIEKELGGHVKSIQTPVLHQWMVLWHNIGTASPSGFAFTIAVLETIVAFCMIFGLFSNGVFLGSAVLSFGIWSTAEGLGLPYKYGKTDIGTSIAYVFVSLALLFAAGGATWSLDARIRDRVGARWAWLISPPPMTPVALTR
jgi:uncharacterized membrane protein YphA (DoxX/SURF4 family)